MNVAAMSVLGDLWPYLVLILAGFLPNEVWRMLGVWVSHSVDEGSELIVWVRAIATAVVTGVVSKIVVFAPGALAAVPLTARLLAAAAGMAAFFLMRGSVLAGIVVGTLGILTGVWVSGG
jgi:Branched-chain amino acid transport protein (AzlD)